MGTPLKVLVPIHINLYIYNIYIHTWFVFTSSTNDKKKLLANELLGLGSLMLTFPKDPFVCPKKGIISTIFWPNGIICHLSLDFPEIRGFPFLSYLSGAQVV